MLKTGATIPKYQPLQVLWQLFMHPHLIYHHFQPLITRELHSAFVVATVWRKPVVLHMCLMNTQAS